MLKRLFSTLLTLGLIAAPITGVAAYGATTAGGHNANSIEELQVGVYYDLNYQCTEDDPAIAVDTPVNTIGWAAAPDVPPGMSADPVTFHISGTPTSSGEWTLPEVTCEFLGAQSFWFENRATGAIRVTGVSAPAAPDLTIIPLNNQSCDYYVLFGTPEGVVPDSSSQTIEITWGANSGRPWIYKGVNQKSHSMMLIHGLKMDQNPGGDDWVQTQADWSNYCWGDVEVTAYYSVGGVRSLEASTTASLKTSNPERLEAWKEVYTPAEGGCLVHIGYTLAKEPDYNVSAAVGGLFLRYVEPDSGYVATFRIQEGHYLSNDDIAFSITNGQLTDSEGGLTTLESIVGASRGCDSFGRVLLEYNSNGVDQQSSRGVVGISKCGKGTYSPSGYDWVDFTCQPANFGSYINYAGATQATSCPTGQTTDQLASASIWDCYKPQTQTLKKLTAIRKLKIGSTKAIATFTDQKIPVKILASGACTAKRLHSKGKVFFKISAAKKLPKGKKISVCKITMSAPAGKRILALHKVLRIGVTATGK